MATLTTIEHPLALFFDGECCFCNRWVSRVMKADRSHRICFGAKQGKTFQQVSKWHPEVARVDSVVLLIRSADGTEKTLTRSSAVLAVIDGLPGYGFFAALLSLVPRFLADIGYRLVSKIRGSIFGRQNICNVVRPEQYELFLD